MESAFLRRTRKKRIFPITFLSLQHLKLERTKRVVSFVGRILKSGHASKNLSESIREGGRKKVIAQVLARI